MKIWKRWTATLASAMLPLLSAAQEFPARPITLVVPFPAGGSGDITARVVADKLGQIWKHPLVIQNKAGGNGFVGMSSVIQAKPDGYTIGLTTAGVTLALAHTKTPPFNLFTDLDPISLVATAPMVLVANSALPINTAKEWAAFVRTSPDKLFYGGTGQGGVGNLAGELIMRQVGGKMTYVPFQGGAPAMAAVVGNQIPLVFNDLASARAFLKAGSIKPILVASARRTPLLPDVAGMADIGVRDVDIKASFGLVAPKGTPASVLREIAERVKQVLAMPDVKERLESLSLEAIGTTPEAYVEFLKAEDAQMRNGIRLTGLRAE
ncbi:Bug family tripartite tricarboxylate transporter substrate binding protein [Hydrogenophaga sp. OTU3427]|uniref:Bug family tripartite tricarboxylate transporter substrate binding protein n=1 Tax=Hydrogenophaga sp. OTU3427 TaxID=3043856 RepID=UPI00313CBA7E